MPATTALKVERPADSDIAAANSRYLPFKMKLAAMERKTKALHNLAAFHRASDYDQKSERFAPLRADIAEAFPDGPPRERLLPGQIEAAEIELEDFRPVFEDERDRWLIAVRAESVRIAERLQPRHLAAAKEIATALESLTKVLAAADEVRTEFASTAPEPTSALLPDVAADLRQCRLDVWDSAAARWARQMRDLRILP